VSTDRRKIIVDRIELVGHLDLDPAGREQPVRGKGREGSFELEKREVERERAAEGEGGRFS